MKLKGARIPHEGVPLASASDCSARADIIRHALGAITSTTPGAVVYVGDGVWDGRAAKALGYSFVGVGQGKRADQLWRVGAASVVADFTEIRAFLTHLTRLAE